MGIEESYMKIRCVKCEMDVKHGIYNDAPAFTLIIGYCEKCNSELEITIPKFEGLE